jgi:hypothetical protein
MLLLDQLLDARADPGVVGGVSHGTTVCRRAAGRSSS